MRASGGPMCRRIWIAKEANVSPATIYIYFENRQDMLNKTYTHVKREMAAVFIKGLKPELSVDEAFKVIWSNFHKYAVKNSAKFSFTEQVPIHARRPGSQGRR